MLSYVGKFVVGLLFCFCSYYYLSCFETRSYSVAQVGLELGGHPPASVPDTGTIDVYHYT